MSDAALYLFWLAFLLTVAGFHLREARRAWREGKWQRAFDRAQNPPPASVKWSVAEIKVPPRPAWRPDEFQLVLSSCETCRDAILEWWRIGFADDHCRKGHPARLDRISLETYEGWSVSIASPSPDWTYRAATRPDWDRSHFPGCPVRYGTGTECLGTVCERKADVIPQGRQNGETE
jgi:hypothetical protein